jgi:hypothetical protein
LGERGNLRWPAQFDAAFGGGLDLQRVALLQLGFLNSLINSADESGRRRRIPGLKISQFFNTAGLVIHNLVARSYV